MAASFDSYLPIAVHGPTGATAATRYAGATTSGAPASGTFAKGDFVITQDGHIYICTTAGSPGTWASVGGGAGVTYGTPALTLGTANAAGSTDESIRRDATILTFDATVPSTQAFGDSAATGSATVAARRDHKHAMPTVEGAIHAATGKTTPDDADEFGIVDSAASNILKKLSGTNLKAYLKSYFDGIYTGSGSGIATDGWISASGVSYSSSDAPTYVLGTSGDLSGTIPVGARLKLTDSTIKYFIVTAISSSTITVYGGTDYTLSGGTISNVYWSPLKVPFGFNPDPAKWSVVVTNSNNCGKSAPTVSTWYGDTGLSSTGPSISVPIGSWLLSMMTVPYARRGAAGTVSVRVSLSTSASAETDTRFTEQTLTLTGNTGADFSYHRANYVLLAAKTTYYGIVESTGTAGAGTSIGFNASALTDMTIIRAECAYL